MAEELRATLYSHQSRSLNARLRDAEESGKRGEREGKRVVCPQGGELTLSGLLLATNLGKVSSRCRLSPMSWGWVTKDETWVFEGEKGSPGALIHYLKGGRRSVCIPVRTGDVIA